MDWWDSGFQNALRHRLRVECRRNGAGNEWEDSVAETLRRVHERILGATESAAIRDPVALAVTVLRGVIVDFRRNRLRHREQRIEDPNLVPAVEVDDAHSGDRVLPSTQGMCRGSMQKAIVAALFRGETLRGLALSLRVPVKVLNRVAGTLAKRMRSDR